MGRTYIEILPSLRQSEKQHMFSDVDLDFHCCLMLQLMRHLPSCFIASVSLSSLKFPPSWNQHLTFFTTVHTNWQLSLDDLTPSLLQFCLHQLPPFFWLISHCLVFTLSACQLTDRETCSLRGECYQGASGLFVCADDCVLYVVINFCFQLLLLICRACCLPVFISCLTWPSCVNTSRWNGN